MRLAWCRHHPRSSMRICRRALQRSHKTVTTPRRRDDVALRLRAVIKRFAQERNVVEQAVFLDDPARPDFPQQFLFIQKATRLLNHVKQCVEYRSEERRVGKECRSRWS